MSEKNTQISDTPDNDQEDQAPEQQVDNQPAQGSQSQGGGLTITPDQVMQHMGLRGNEMQPFSAAVKSCIHIIVDANTHPLFLEGLRGPGPITQKLADEARGLVLLVARQAKGAFPQMLYVPVGVYMIAWVANYLDKSGLAQVQNQDVGAATQMFVHDMVSMAQKQQPPGIVGGAQQSGAGPTGGAPGGQMPPQVPPGANGPASPQATPEPAPALPKMQATPQAAPGSNPPIGPMPRKGLVGANRA